MTEGIIKRLERMERKQDFITSLIVTPKLPKIPEPKPTATFGAKGLMISSNEHNLKQLKKEFFKLLKDKTIKELLDIEDVKDEEDKQRSYTG